MAARVDFVQLHNCRMYNAGVHMSFMNNSFDHTASGSRTKQRSNGIRLHLGPLPYGYISSLKFSIAHSVPSRLYSQLQVNCLYAMDASSIKTIIRAAQAPRISSNGTDRPHLEVIANDYLAPILSYLIDSDDFFHRTCAVIAQYARVSRESAAHAVSEQTRDVRNASLVCRNICPAAQEYLFRTVYINDACWANENQFLRSELFRFIRLLLDHSHLRGHVKNLHITLPSDYYYGNGDECSDVQHKLLALMQSDVKKANRWSKWLAAVASDPEVIMSDKRLGFWLTGLFMLVPKLQCLGLWGGYAERHKMLDWQDDELHEMDEIVSPPQHFLVGSSLLWPEKLHYISLHVYGAHDLSILHSLPNVKTADIWPRYEPGMRVSSALKKVTHIPHLRFSFDLAIRELELDKLTPSLLDIFTGFQNVRTITIYEIDEYFGLGGMHEIFSKIARVLVPVQGTLEQLRCCPDHTMYYLHQPAEIDIPDLSEFSKIKVLSIHQTAISFTLNQEYDAAYNEYIQDRASDSPLTTKPASFNCFLPHMESLVIYHCNSYISKFLDLLMEFDYMVPELRRVELHFNDWNQGPLDYVREYVLVNIDCDGFWKDSIHSRIKVVVPDPNEKPPISSLRM